MFFLLALNRSVNCSLFNVQTPGGTPLQEANGDVPLDGSHFHDWSDYDGVAFSTDLLEWGRKFFGFWG